MFNRIINTQGFWKSVISLGIAFVLLFIIFKWFIDGYKFAFFLEGEPTIKVIGIIAAGFVYGFFVTYGKFWGKYKKENRHDS